MRCLFLFKIFLEELYKIKFSDHWIEKTFLEFDKDSNKLRILKRTFDFLYRWKII